MVCQKPLDIELVYAAPASKFKEKYMKISKSDIETIEVETSNICNLKCPLCVS